VTRRPDHPQSTVAIVLSIVFLMNSLLFAVPGAGASEHGRAHQRAESSDARSRPSAAAAHRRVHACHRNTRSVRSLPAPLVGFETPYVPGSCDPMHLLPKQAWRMFACVRWREGGDTANQPNGAGMYQFTNRATWNEFRGRFAEVPSDATALQQDIVAYRAWKAEQFLPWNGDPCLGSVRQYGKWGWY
jgi:hypothetical protein